MTRAKTWQDSAPTLIEDALAPQVRDRILAYFDGHVPRPRSYQGVIDPRLRQCDFVAIADRALVAEVHVITRTISAAFGVPVTTVAGQAPLIYRYGVGVGFATHHDEVTERELARAKVNGQPVVYGDITATVSLSDPDTYQGGELYFIDAATEFKPRAGSAVTFPATRRHLHGVRPITDGCRFVLLMRFAVQRSDALPATTLATPASLPKQMPA